MLDAESFNPLMCAQALNLNCVVFNVDYRLGPENKCPKGQEDFAKVIEHIYNNAESFGVNN